MIGPFSKSHEVLLIGGPELRELERGEIGNQGKVIIPGLAFDLPGTSGFECYAPGAEERDVRIRHGLFTRLSDFNGSSNGIE